MLPEVPKFVNLTNDQPTSFRSSRSQASVPRQCKTVEDIARLIVNQSAKNIVVMVGAGISTPSGIPDFR